MWMVWAGLAALFSALVAILSKLGLDGINSHFATAVRTTAVMVITWLFVWGMGVKGAAMTITRSQLFYLVLSAIATGGAWICYNRALQEGPATRVASIDKLSIVLIALLSWMVFGENMSPLAIASIALITLGTVLLVFA
ncbi:MAG: EamA family transporter [Planctomycetaceae bacterium]|nr:EamA family transporter [Planctomycetaceae bacterium]